MNGYRSACYARSLAEFGSALHLPASDGWLIERTIGGAGQHDAMGCYPLFSCADWQGLRGDLDAFGEGLVSVVLVTDPFGEFTVELLERAFDRVVPFKEHLVVDLTAGGLAEISSHHRYYAKRALRTVDVEVCADPAAFLHEWCGLYQHLVDRHGLTGVKAFSRATFAEQLRVPGTLLMRAAHSGRTVGAHWFFVDGDVSYSHLTALSPEGYSLGAAYALQWRAIEYLANRVRLLDLGAGAGARSSLNDGLGRFKAGWTNATRPVYICGRVLSPAAYAGLTAARGTAGSAYFPAYREGELV